MNEEKTKTNHPTNDNDISVITSKIEMLSKDVTELKKSRDEIRSSNNELYSYMSEMNKNIEKMMNKMDSFSTANVEPIDFEEEKEPKVKRKMKAPLRSIVVGVLSTVYSITDKTMERASGIKENFEDIVAEAQYKNVKRRTVTEQ